MRSSSRLGSAPVGAPKAANIQVGAVAAVKRRSARWSVQNDCLYNGGRSELLVEACQTFAINGQRGSTAPRPRVVIIIAASMTLPSKWLLILQQCGLCLGMLRRPHCAATAAARAASIAGRQRSTWSAGKPSPCRWIRRLSPAPRSTTRRWHRSTHACTKLGTRARPSNYCPSFNGSRELRDNVLDAAGTLSSQILSSKLKRVVVSPLDRIKIR